jgi:hypothetical protein
MFKQLSCAATAMALVMTGAPAHAEKYPKVGKDVVFAPTVDHTGDASTLVWVNRPGAAKGVTKVVIPFFQVQFVVDSDTSANISGGAHSKTMVTLVGPTPAQMQAITDRLYAKVVADLGAAGLTVIDPATARAFPNYAQLQDGGKPSGTKVDGHQGVNSLFFAPSGMTFYFLPTQDIAYTGAGSFGGFQTAMLPPREQALMQESGAAVLGFRAVVDFASLASSDKAFLGHFRSSAKTSAAAAIAIRPIATQLWLMTPNAKPGITDMLNRMRFEVQAPLVIDTPAITAMTDARTRGDKRGEVLGNVASALLGGGMSKTRKYDIAVDPAVWERDVEASLNGVAQMFVVRLKSEL